MDKIMKMKLIFLTTTLGLLGTAHGMEREPEKTTEIKTATIETNNLDELMEMAQQFNLAAVSKLKTLAKDNKMRRFWEYIEEAVKYAPEYEKFYQMSKNRSLSSQEIEQFKQLIDQWNANYIKIEHIQPIKKIKDCAKSIMAQILNSISNIFYSINTKNSIERAMKYWNGTMQEVPSYVPAHINYAHCCIDKKKFIEAIEVLKPFALKHYYAAYLTGYAYEKFNDATHATNWYKQAQELKKTYTVSEKEKLLELPQSDEDIYKDIYSRLREMHKTLIQNYRALKLPHNTITYEEFVGSIEDNLLYCGKKLSEIKSLESDMATLMAKVYNLCGKCLEKFDKYQAALNNWNSCIKNRPEWASPYIQSALCLFHKLNKIENAIKKLHPINEKDVRAACLTGDLHMNFGTFELSKQWYQKALILKEQHPESKITQETINKKLDNINVLIARAEFLLKSSNKDKDNPMLQVD